MSEKPIDLIEEAPKLTFEEYRQWVSDTALYPTGLSYPISTMVCEAAEAQGILLKVSRATGQMSITNEDLTPEMREALLKEVSDALWGIVASMNELGVTLGDIANINYAKLSERMDRGTHFNRTHMSSDALAIVEGK